MDAIEFNLTARDYSVAGKIRKAIREHRAALNLRECQAHTYPTQVAPSASRYRAILAGGTHEHP